ncbi:MAG TPA: hypothetical protein ENI48_03225 [Thioploca sp.]|nr:hypothetical protein [Thioploca sp.]
MSNLRIEKILWLKFYRVTGLQDLSWQIQTKVWTPHPTRRFNKVLAFMIQDKSQIHKKPQTHTDPLR